MIKRGLGSCRRGRNKRLATGGRSWVQSAIHLSGGRLIATSQGPAPLRLVGRAPGRLTDDPRSHHPDPDEAPAKPVPLAFEGPDCGRKRAHHGPAVPP